MFQQAIKPLLKIAAVAALAVLVPGTQSPAYAQVTPYLGQMMYAGFNFAPKGWAMCNGQLLAINQNQALFALIGTFYGGNGTTNFALPNLSGVAAAHQGQGAGLNNLELGELDTAPATHQQALPGTVTVARNMLAGTASGNALAVFPAEPSLTITFCIALQGIFPSRN